MEKRLAAELSVRRAFPPPRVEDSTVRVTVGRDSSSKLLFCVCG